MMKDDEDWWIACWRFSYGGRMRTCFCENLRYQAWMPELRISSAKKCVDLFFFSSVTYRTDGLFVPLLERKQAFLFALFDCNLITFHAFLSYTTFFFLCCLWNYPPHPLASPFFSPRGLFVEVMACWCLRLSLGPYCWCFFPHTHTDTHIHTHTCTQTCVHSGPSLLTLNFILCHSCICCHHGDLVYYLTPPPTCTHKHTHTQQWNRQTASPSVFDLVL